MSFKWFRLLPVLLCIFIIWSAPVPVAASDGDVKIPACLLSYKFGPEQYVLIVEKSTQTLFVYSNYNPEPIERFTITTGKNNGRKLIEGDLKTPEGLYFFRRILAGNQLPKVDDYGEKAFTLNYPNAIDRREERKGSGIWLHGAFDETKTDNPNNSRGCVVLKNDDLIKVSKYVFLNKTPICIYDKILFDTYANVRQKRDHYLQYLKEWKEHWETKNIDQYIRFYTDDFKYNGMNLNQFKDHKDRLNQSYRFIKVNLSDINLYAFDGYYVVLFNQLYVSDRNHFYNHKIQYWDKKSGTIPKIVAEMTSPLPDIDKYEVSKGNYVSIDKFREDYLRALQEGTSHYSPHDIRLADVSVFKEQIKVVINNSSSTTGLKVIPVVRLEKDGDSIYKSADGIPIDRGRPQDYSTAVPLDGSTTTVIINGEKDYELKSLTMFVVDEKNEKQQLVTYFINN